MANNILKHLLETVASNTKCQEKNVGQT